MKTLDKNEVAIILWDLLKETNLSGAPVTVEVDKAVMAICNLGIPDKILNGEVDHTEPYKGDNGIQFEPIKS